MVNYLTVNLRRGELSGSGPRSTKRTVSLFIAFRFNATESIKFRESIDQKLSSTISLRDVEVLDGKAVLLGEDWSGKIRDLLKRAKLVVADLTALSPEVVFECGYALGVGRQVLPVVADPSWYNRLPRWLTTLQIGCFGNEEGWNSILDTIDKCLNKGQLPKQDFRPSPPDPGQSLWLPGPEWFAPRAESLVNVANRFDMNTPEIHTLQSDLEDAYKNVLEQASKASLIVAAVDNTPADAFVHYLSGLVVSKPKAGVSRRKLERRVLIVVNDATKPENILCDSARRAHKVVHVTTLAGLNDELLKFGESYRRWRKDCEGSQ